MFCEKCGQKLADGARFCEACGQPVTAPPASAGDTQAPAPQPDPAVSAAPAPIPEPAGEAVRPDSAPKKKKGRAKVVVIVLICVLLTAALSVLLVMLLNNMNLQAEQAPAAAVTEPSLSAESSTAPASAAPTEAPTEPPTLSSPTEAPTLPADGVADATRFSGALASSTLPDQAGHSYRAANVLKPDEACWCEGADSYGEGEWLRLDLPGEERLYGLSILNGYAGTERQYTYNSKPSEILLEFSDGSIKRVSLDVYPVSQRRTVQDIVFDEPVVTDFVKITILSVEKGDCADTCLTYVAPYLPD